MELLDLITGEVVTEKYQRNFTCPVKNNGEPGDPRTKTEMAYVPPKAQINDMLQAGERLAAYRKARFGKQEEVLQEEEEQAEPGIQPGMDLVDVQRAAEALEARLTANEKAAAEKAAKEASDARKAAFDQAVQLAAEKLAASKVTP